MPSVGKGCGVEAGADGAEGWIARALITSGNVRASALDSILLPFEEIRTRSGLPMIGASAAGVPSAAAIPTPATIRQLRYEQANRWKARSAHQLWKATQA